MSELKLNLALARALLINMRALFYFARYAALRAALCLVLRAHFNFSAHN